MSNSRNVLVVDDEVKILEVVKSFLESKGFTVFCAENGKDALHAFENNPITLVLLDLMLPDISGEEVCMAIRKRSRVPIIMLTAKVAEDDLLTGLGIGADDYITKPFSLKELYARIDAVLRRSQGDLQPLYQKTVLGDGDLIIDTESRIVKKQGQDVSLTPNEYKIFSALMKYPGKVFTREELIELVLGDEFEGYDRAIDSHIKNLRQKIESDPKNPVYIITVHGVGYRFGGRQV